ncbi:hypothetical protein GBA52_015043 [Prunus armeniaca]|nr:hypothetical protein GBA52_015043 [Prunus armeniaca]
MITYDEEVHRRNMISDEMVWGRDGWVLLEIAQVCGRWLSYRPGDGGLMLGMKIGGDDFDLIYRGWVALDRSISEFIP